MKSNTCRNAGSGSVSSFWMMLSLSALMKQRLAPRPRTGNDGSVLFAFQGDDGIGFREFMFNAGSREKSPLSYNRSRASR
jgi:hypothetical protein